ncbi:GTPase activating protein [Rhizophlyctis rosea]|uniref:GTPase activating protein n=1 Tax=Rhizophlyctis rosea TaxID=64517 RepID=A0AAD5SIC6_9FUNG|nr:GTPase activating protein [Rhizophlyctis rosea]
MAANNVQLLHVRSNVSIRSSDTELLVGYLCLAAEEESSQHLFAWIPKTTIPAQDFHKYEEVAARTRVLLTLISHTAPIVSSPSHSLSLITEAISAPMDDVRSFTLSPELTLSGNDEVCLTRLTVELNFAGAKLPDLWFEKDHGVISDLSAVESLLRAWCRAIGKDLAESSSEEAPSVRTFKIVPLEGGSSSLAAARRPRQWPEGLPTVPQDSALYKIGTVGFGLVSGLLGQPTATKIEDVGWDMLERFSRVTNIARNTGAQVLEHPLARPILPLIPTNIRSLFLSSAEAEALLEEYDSFGQYLARYAGDLGGRLRRDRRAEVETILDKTGDFEVLAVGRTHHRTKQPLSAEHWVSWYDPKGRLVVTADYVKAYVFTAGVENDIRPDVWKYLLDVFPYNSTDDERMKLLDAKRQEYESMRNSWQKILAEAAGEVPEEQDTASSNARAGDEREDGDVVSKLRERKYRIEKDVVRTDRTVPFFVGSESDLANAPPVPGSEDEAGPPASFSANLEMLKNVLMTYTMYNFELGYVQGMNDLLAPILAVMRSESEAFWCFAEFMKTMQHNFFRDQSGMRTQLRRLELLIKFIDPFLYEHLEATDSINLFICFRWLLVLFKREFDFQDTSTLWEVIWACPLTRHFHLFIALAILNARRVEIFKCTAFDENLKFVNEQSGNINLIDTLQRAEVLFYVFRDKLTHEAKARLDVDVDTRATADLPGASENAKRTHLSVDDRDGRGGKADAKGSTRKSASASRSRSRTPEPLRKAVECTEEELWELVNLVCM